VIVTSDWARKTFRVKAIRITAENMAELAEWCGGEIRDSDLPATNAASIGVPTGHVGGRTQRTWAYVGDWITRLSDANNFRVYKNRSFLLAFQEIMSESEKYAKIHEMLMQIRNAQDSATYWEQSSEGVLLLVDQTAQKICEMM
jgi:hypothetical protein